jgi:hypothetical protein
MEVLLLPTASLVLQYRKFAEWCKDGTRHVPLHGLLGHETFLDLDPLGAGDALLVVRADRVALW